MNEREKELGRIEYVKLGREDHGVMTMTLGFDFGCSFQAFGGYFLDDYDNTLKKRVGSAAGMDFVIRVLDTFNVDDINDIKGKYAFAIRDNGEQKIIGFETPKTDGGKKFLITDWQKRWFKNGKLVKE